MISSVTPSMVSTTSFKGQTDEVKKDDNKDSQNKIEKLEQKGEDLNKSLEVVNDTLEKTTGLAGKTAVSVAGLWAIIVKPFKGIADWVKQPETKEGITKTVDFAKNNKKGVIIGAAIAAGSILALVAGKKIKKAKAEKAAQQQALMEQQKAEAEAKAKAQEKEEEHKLDIVSEAE